MLQQEREFNYSFTGGAGIQINLRWEPESSKKVYK